MVVLKGCNTRKSWRERRPVMKTTYPTIDDHSRFLYGSPHRKHWQFALLAGVAMESVIAVTALFAMLAAMVTM